MEKFHKNTGFTVNYDKTQMYRIGSFHNTLAEYYTATNLKWTNDPINVLGVWITHDAKEIMSLNYDGILSKAKKILNMWMHHNLSLCAKISVINTLVGSLFVYKMMVLPNMEEYVISSFEKTV